MAKDLTKEMYFTENRATTLRELKNLANDLLDTTWTIGIYRYQDAKVINLRQLGWRFEFNTRRRAAGLCNYSTKQIFLSEWLVKQNLDQAIEWENTLRHELAHAIDGAMGGRNGHNKVWKAIARDVLCTAERCYSTNVIQTKVTTKYTLICDSCGKEKASHKVKKSKTACGDCCRAHNGGRYTDKFVLRQVQNY